MLSRFLIMCALQACPASFNFAARCKGSFLRGLQVGTPLLAESDHKTCRAGPTRPGRSSGARGGAGGGRLARCTPPSVRTRSANGGARAEQWGRPGRREEPSPASSATPDPRPAPAPRGPPRLPLRARPSRRAFLQLPGPTLAPPPARLLPRPGLAGPPFPDTDPRRFFPRLQLLPPSRRLPALF